MTSVGPTTGTREVNLQLTQDRLKCLVTLYTAPRTTMDAHLSMKAQGLAQHVSL